MRESRQFVRQRYEQDLAASGRIEDCRPLLERLQAMADDLMHEASRLSIEALRLRIEAVDDPARM